MAIQLMHCYDRDALGIRNNYGSTAFGRAAHHGQLRWFQAAIARLEGLAEADPSWGDFLTAMLNSQNNEGHTVLMEAVKSGHVELAQLLLDHGVDPKTPTRNGYTVVHFARLSGDARWEPLLANWSDIPALAP